MSKSKQTPCVAETTGKHHCILPDSGGAAVSVSVSPLGRVARFGALAPRWRFQNWDGAQKFDCGAERQMALWELEWRSLWRFDS